AGRDDNVFGLKFGLPARVGHLDAVGIEKARRSGDHFDAVARKLGANYVDLRLDDVERAEGKISHGAGFLHAVVYAVHALVLIGGKVQHGFADGLAGDGAGVGGHSTDDFELLDERRTLAELCSLNSSALSCRTGTDHDEIVLFHGSPREYRR